MKAAVVTRLVGWALLLAAVPSLGQIAIQNPKKLPVPEARVAVIYDVVRELVFEQVKPAGGKMVNLRLTLALSVRPQAGYLTDEENGTVEIYLKEWDEVRFAQAVMALALQQALPAKRRQEILQEAQRRVDLLAPVDVSRLKKEELPARPPSGQQMAAGEFLLTCSSARMPQPAECQRLSPSRQLDAPRKLQSR